MKKRVEIEELLKNNSDDQKMVDRLKIELLLDIRDLLARSSITPFRHPDPPKVF